MATKGGEERTGDAVPVVTGASCFIGSWIINPLPDIQKPGMKSLVAWFTFFHGPVSGLVMLAISYVVLEKIVDHISQMLALSTFVESFAAMLMLSLLFSGWWSWVLSFFALLMVIVTVKLSVRLLYVALSGSYSSFSGDIIKATVAVAAVIAGELALSFLGAMVFVRFLYGTNGHSQSQRGLTSGHCASSEG